MSEFTVVVTDHRFGDLSIEREHLADIADVQPLDPERRREQLATADALINLVAELDAGDVGLLEACRVIARYGIGVDNIDVGAATERGIYVANVPDYCIEEVATHALALVLALDRRLTGYDDAMAAGAWKDAGVPPITNRFSSQTVGVVGFGAIGRAVGGRAAALGATVLASDPYLTPEDLAAHDATLVGFEELLERSDFVTVHSPLTEETRGLFDADAFARMKGSAHLVNVARGPIVDEAALVEALDDGEIAGAGLDVFSEEPPAEDNPLRTHPAVITTPHVAWYSEEADRERRHAVGRNVRAALLGERPPNAVNDPG